MESKINYKEREAYHRIINIREKLENLLTKDENIDIPIEGMKKILSRMKDTKIFFVDKED